MTDVEAFRREVREAIARCRTNVEALASAGPGGHAGGPEGSERTIEAFDALLAPLNGPAGRVSLFVHVHPDAAMREACEELEQEIATLRTDVSLDRRLYDRLTALDPDEMESPAERRLLEHGLRDFRRSGVDRDAVTRARIKALQEELVRIGQEFDRNIITGGREFVIADGHAGLAGLPQDFLASHPEREDGSVVLTTDPTDRIPFITYAERGDLRRAYFRECMNRAVPENLEVLPRLLARRHELAALLGYPHWADYVTEDKMSRSAERARTFVERVVELVRERAAAETQELLEEKRRTDPGATDVRESERAFLTEKLRRRRFAFDSQSVRPYFPYERVKQGVIETSARLYGVEFRPNPDAELWHPAVECYDVVDGGEVVARFYLDMHPRDDKYKHGAMFDLTGGYTGGALPEATLVCNFPEPRDGDPGLLLHDQVLTFFHEFGHLLHHLFAANQRFLSFAGISTEHDFVEVPSQMYEEWAWSPDVLRGFALHHENGEPLPEEAVRRMRAAEEYGKGLEVLGQMVFAMLSLTYHDRDPAGVDVTETMNEIKRELWPLTAEEENHFHASFGHLNGYSAMYYTYMWSLVIAKDLFSRFEPDLMDGATANEYRARILEPGGSKDARDLVREFLGREYAFDAFERWLGL